MVVGVGGIGKVKSEQKPEASKGFHEAEVRDKGTIRTNILRQAYSDSLNVKEARMIDAG